MLNEPMVATAACERLKIPLTNRLSLQSYIPNALNNLARQVAIDPSRRKLLLTSQTAVTAAVSTTNYESYADLSTAQDVYGIMFDYLQYGTIYYVAATKTWTSADVESGDPSLITILNHGYVTGQPVRLTTDGTLPSGVSTGITYYVVVVDDQTVQLSINPETLQPAIFNSVGSGTSTMTAYSKDVVQWLASPTQGMLEQCVPFDYIYVWLEQNLLYTNRINGTFKFSVPYIPTLASIPEVLESDLIDSVVQLAVTGGFSPIPPAAQ